MQVQLLKDLRRNIVHKTNMGNEARWCCCLCEERSRFRWKWTQNKLGIVVQRVLHMLPMGHIVACYCNGSIAKIGPQTRSMTSTV